MRHPVRFIARAWPPPACGNRGIFRTTRARIKRIQRHGGWLKVSNELKNRGLHDILIAVVDGLRGFPEGKYPEFSKLRQTISKLIRPSVALVLQLYAFQY